MPRELWLTIAMDATVATLYQEIAKLLRRESPLLADICRPIELHLVDPPAEGPFASSAGAHSLALPSTLGGSGINAQREGARKNEADQRLQARPLREIFWAQSETVRVELEAAASKRPSANGLWTVGAGGRWPKGASSGTLRLLIWRERAFEPASTGTSGRLGDYCTSSLLGSTWSRQTSAPVNMGFEDLETSGWSRQVSEPLNLGDVADGAGGWGRQVSEPVPALPRCEPPVCPPPSSIVGDRSGGLGWRRDITELGSSRAQLHRASSERGCWMVPEAESDSPGGLDREAGAGSADRVLLAGHPGDTAVEIPPEDSAMEDHGVPEQVLRECVGAGPVPKKCWERIVPHFAPRMLPRTLRARQFEFHPSLPDLLLMGDKRGMVNVLDTEADEVHPGLLVGNCPLLGLVWMRHHPQNAVCGASHTGKIIFLRYDPQAKTTEPALQRVRTAEGFPKLSSLSANCTDDFLLASGISPNIAIYDVQTGQVLSRAHGVHEHFINISRFCHTSPHIFATASWDHTCKVWDLRQPLVPDKPVKVVNTGGHNVMCVFSPDDRHVLCSGVDTRILQFEVRSWRQTPSQFPLRGAVHRERYRRSTYLANSRHFVTAATEESHMHLLGVDGQKHGVVDFRGVIQEWTHGASGLNAPNLQGNGVSFQGHGGNDGSALSAHHEVQPPPQVPLCLQAITASAPSRLLAGRTPWIFSSQRGANLWQAPRSGRHDARNGNGAKNQHLVQGSVQLDDADPEGGSSRNNHEFVQSIRSHPTITNRVGVLLSLTQGEQSYVSLVDLDPQVLK
jgi:hypothetical protein